MSRRGQFEQSPSPSSTRRILSWRHLLWIVTTGVVVGLFMLPQVRWPLLGWARGEPFWRGYPSSYYAARFRAETCTDAKGHLSFRKLYMLEDWGRQRLSPTVVEAMWGGPIPLLADDPPDVNALPVLRRLLRDPDVGVRWCALGGLGLLLGDGAPALPELVVLLDDPQLKINAIQGLMFIGPAARPAIPRLRAMQDDSEVREWAHRAVDALESSDRK
jgi:hypothetical protein